MPYSCNPVPDLFDFFQESLDLQKEIVFDVPIFTTGTDDKSSTFTESITLSWSLSEVSCSFKLSKWFVRDVDVEDCAVPFGCRVCAFLGMYGRRISKASWRRSVKASCRTSSSDSLRLVRYQEVTSGRYLIARTKMVHRYSGMLIVVA